MLGISLIMLLFIALMSIVGVQLFSGKFWYCMDADGYSAENVTTRAECVPYTDSDGVNATLTWKNPVLHFDDFLHAALSVTELTFGSGSTMDLMYFGMDVTDVCAVLGVAAADIGVGAPDHPP